MWPGRPGPWPAARPAGSRGRRSRSSAPWLADRSEVGHRPSFHPGLGGVEGGLVPGHPNSLNPANQGGQANSWRCGSSGRSRRRATPRGRHDCEASPVGSPPHPESLVATGPPQPRTRQANAIRVVAPEAALLTKTTGACGWPARSRCDGWRICAARPTTSWPAWPMARSSRRSWMGCWRGWTRSWPTISRRGCDCARSTRSPPQQPRSRRQPRGPHRHRVAFLGYGAIRVRLHCLT
jgi:hypothetical protein